MEEQKKDGMCCSGGSCGSCKGGACSPMHWSCCVVPLLSLIFWIGGIVALILAWSAGDSLLLGKADAYWYLNALALGVLAAAGRGKKLGACRKSGCGTGGCSGCKDGVCK